MSKKCIPFKITASLAKMGSEEFDIDDPIMRFDFVCSPLVPDSPVFRFMRYCSQSDITKGGEHDIRRLIARDLRDKHRAMWERFHRWAEERA